MGSFKISNDLMEIFATFITIIGTYFITKFQIMNPSKIEIKRQQLKNVYLPLYRLISNSYIEEMNEGQLIKFIDKVTEIIEKNFIYIYPDLLELYKDLRFKIYSHQDITSTYEKFCNIVFYDYEKLKRYLGYPSESYKDFFSRVDTATKIKEILSWVSLLVLFIPILFLVLSDDINDFSFFRFTASYITIFLCIIKLNEFLTSLQRRK